MSWMLSHALILPPLFLCALGIAFFSRRLDKGTYRFFLRLLMAILFFCEFSKQLIAFYRNYTPLYLPFHYSTSYYVCMSFYAFGGKRIQHAGKCILYVGGFLLLGTMLASPYSVIGDPALMFQTFGCFYSVFYHMMILLVWFCMLARREYRVKKFDPLIYLTFLCTWGAFAIPAAKKTGFNYAGILRSYIPFLQGLCESNHTLYLIVYFSGVMVLAVTVIYLYWHLQQIMIQRRGKNYIPEL